MDLIVRKSDVLVGADYANLGSTWFSFRVLESLSVQEGIVNPFRSKLFLKVQDCTK